MNLGEIHGICVDFLQAQVLGPQAEILGKIQGGIQEEILGKIHGGRQEEILGKIQVVSVRQKSWEKFKPFCVDFLQAQFPEPA